MGRGRPAYRPTAAEKHGLWELENLTGQLAAIKAEREEVIDALLDRGVPALHVAKAANLQPSTLSMRVRRRRVVRRHAV